MNDSETADAIRGLLPNLSGQIADAARFLLAHPQDAAVCSMRELARRAEVPPVTLVRLAQRLGLPSYSELRRRYVDVLIRRGKQGDLAATRNVDSAQAILDATRVSSSLLDFAETFFAAEREVLRLALSGLTEQPLNEAAERLASANRIFVAARRTPFPTAFTLAYALRKARAGVTLLDDSGGAPEGALEDIAPGDAFVAITFAPFSRMTDTLARRAAEAGACIIAISDSNAAPLRELAGELFFVAPTFSRAFPESAGGALAVANLLTALTVAKLGAAAQRRIRKNERQIVESGEFMLAGRKQRRSRRTI